MFGIFRLFEVCLASFKNQSNFTLKTQPTVSIANQAIYWMKHPNRALSLTKWQYQSQV